MILLMTFNALCAQSKVVKAVGQSTWRAKNPSVLSTNGKKPRLSLLLKAGMMLARIYDE
jgi:hypothetical protein